MHRLKCLTQAITLIWTLSAPVSSPLGAQALLVIDLGHENAGENLTASVSPGRYTLRIISRVPGVAYDVSAIRRTIPIAPLAVIRDSSSETKLTDPCPELTTAASELNALTVTALEKDVRQRVKDIEAAIQQAGSKCPAAVAAVRALVIEKTTYEWPTLIVLEAGQELEVTVVRSTTQGAGASTWRKTWSTGSRGEWRVTYGFGVEGNGWKDRGALGRRESFYSRAAGDSSFVLARGTDRQGADVLPAIFYSYMPREGLARRRSWGPTAGLGTDLKTPLLLLGYGVTYEQNLAVNIGLLARRDRVLLEKYAGGDTVRTDLTWEQLSREAFRIRPYVAVTLRFGANPFGSGDDEKSKDAPKEEPKSAGGTPATTPPKEE